MVGLTRFELVTPRLSSVCSNQLSYRPVSSIQRTEASAPVPSKLNRTCSHLPVKYQIDLSKSPKLALQTISRKDAIQPQVLLHLPCYDFTPITNHTLAACPPSGLARRLLVQPAFVM